MTESLLYSWKDDRATAKRSGVAFESRRRQGICARCCTDHRLHRFLRYGRGDPGTLSPNIRQHRTLVCIRFWRDAAYIHGAGDFDRSTPRPSRHRQRSNHRRIAGLPAECHVLCSLLERQDGEDRRIAGVAQLRSAVMNCQLLRLRPFVDIHRAPRFIGRVANIFQLALRAFRLAGYAKCSSMPDYAVREVDPLLAGNHLHQILLD